jgi:hypothetical protein
MHEKLMNSDRLHTEVMDVMTLIDVCIVAESEDANESNSSNVTDGDEKMTEKWATTLLLSH